MEGKSVELSCKLLLSSIVTSYISLFFLHFSFPMSLNTPRKHKMQKLSKTSPARRYISFIEHKLTFIYIVISFYSNVYTYFDLCFSYAIKFKILHAMYNNNSDNRQNFSQFRVSHHTSITWMKLFIELATVCIYVY